MLLMLMSMGIMLISLVTTGGGFATMIESIDNTKVYVVPINLTLVTT
jgi:hypothetical protein